MVHLRRGTFVGLLISLTGALGGALSAQAEVREASKSPAAPQATTSKVGVAIPAVTIGVVDLDKAIANYPTARREEAELQKLSEQFTAQLDQRSQKIDELIASLRILKPGAPKYAEMQFELQSRQRDQKDLADFLRQQFNVKAQELEVRLFEDLEFAIKKVAEDNGITIVLRAQDSLDIGAKEVGEPDSVRDKARRFAQRTVWFADSSVDLTPALIKYLSVYDPRKEREKLDAANARKNGTQNPKKGGATGGDKKASPANSKGGASGIPGK